MLRDIGIVHQFLFSTHWIPPVLKVIFLLCKQVGGNSCGVCRPRLAVVLALELHRGAYRQQTVINAAILGLRGVFQSMERGVGRDDHGLAGQHPAVNHIKHTFLAEAGAALCAQIVQNQQIGAHQGFDILLPVFIEQPLQLGDNGGHSDEQHGNLAVNQGVCNAPRRIGLARADIPKQAQAEVLYFGLIHFWAYR